jgi:hypothetical protein
MMLCGDSPDTTADSPFIFKVGEDHFGRSIDIDIDPSEEYH